MTKTIASNSGAITTTEIIPHKTMQFIG